MGLTGQAKVRFRWMVFLSWEGGLTGEHKVCVRRKAPSVSCPQKGPHTQLEVVWEWFVVRTVSYGSAKQVVITGVTLQVARLGQMRGLSCCCKREGFVQVGEKQRNAVCQRVVCSQPLPQGEAAVV